MLKSAIIYLTPLMLISFLFSGCVQTQTKVITLPKKELVTTKQEIKPRPKKEKIIINKHYEEAFKRWENAIKDLLDFYEWQVKENNKLIKRG